MLRVRQPVQLLCSTFPNTSRALRTSHSHLLCNAAAAAAAPQGDMLASEEEVIHVLSFLSSTASRLTLLLLLPFLLLPHCRTPG